MKENNIQFICLFFLWGEGGGKEEGDVITKVVMCGLAVKYDTHASDSGRAAGDHQQQECGEEKS